MELRRILIPARFLYTFAVIVCFILVIAIVFYFMSYIIGAVQGIGRTIALAFGSVDATYVSIDSFFTLLFTVGFLALAVLVLGLWVWRYTQLKGRIMGE